MRQSNWIAIVVHGVSNQVRSISTVLRGQTFRFTEGETIHTENSYKYTVEGFARLAESAGLSLQQSWLDAERLFSVHYLAAGSRPCWLGSLPWAPPSAAS